MSTFTRDPEFLMNMNALSVVLIGPHEGRRRSLARAIAGPQANILQQIPEYPSVDALLSMVEPDCDVLIIDLDPDPERALDLVESVCSNNSAITVMIHSSRNDSELLIRCMRAGARELLTDPVQPAALAEALVRAAARRSEVRRQKKVAGKMLVFIGAKGGSGVTTVASNFGIALARECRQPVALVDMDLQLGDAALAIGLKPEFSVMDALRNSDRLDSDFLSTLLTRHNSGLCVLGAPDEYTPFRALDERAGKVLRILREDFAYVVVDGGSNFGSVHEHAFEIAESIYLVAEVNIPSLRNANRLITHFDKSDLAGRVEVVLNRFDGRSDEIDEERIAKALTRTPKWKVANDFSAVRRAQNTGIPLASEETAVSRVLYEMARVACGKLAAPVKKRRFGLFG